VKLTYVLLTCALLFLLCVSFERQAYAYVDPGSSLLVFQTLSAVVTGVLFSIRKRLKTLLTRSKRSEVDLDVKPR
jgi:hypothetical protein